MYVPQIMGPNVAKPTDIFDRELNAGTSQDINSPAACSHIQNKVYTDIKIFQNCMSRAQEASYVAMRERMLSDN